MPASRHARSRNVRPLFRIRLLKHGGSAPHHSAENDSSDPTRGSPVSSPTLTQTTPPRDLSNWYLGLHSGTRCIATSQADVRVSKDGHPVPVYLCPPSGTHPICKVWETIVTSSIIPIADRLGVPFTCIVLICIARPSGEVGETEKEDAEERWPPIIWVAVKPGWSDRSPSGRFVEEVMEVLWKS
ncbi:uncharacterized protein MKK02DRAFT_32655 [Dioszegia hungarica]|uniref:Uncharacterized protein n=1 Tax=Dioszegia hungarica TaxID=4972 RepID=A0AA38H6S6_9TREE|nr:uncharacterized protein MKK02DRAFT_32655 [Dioszegia hungarica]KAI9635170.1 hypothetical protein MKK02DRAFT_32655 [Dioszegia hungarica]